MWIILLAVDIYKKKFGQFKNDLAVPMYLTYVHKTRFTSCTKNGFSNVTTYTKISVQNQQ